MANEKVSQMTPLSAAEVAFNDLFYIIDTSQKQSKQIAAQDLLTYIEATGSFNAVTSQTAVSASHVPGSGVDGIVVSASYALNTSVSNLTTGSLLPMTSSQSQTASFLAFASNRSNGTASMAISASSTVLATSASFLISLPGVTNGTASFALSSSQAATSSYSNVSNSTISSSFATTTVTASFANSIANPIPAGTVITFASATIPSGWLECNGNAVNQSTYPALFAAIAFTYGSGSDAGATTFSLPDLRGYFVRGWDHGRGVDSGRNIGTSQLDALKDHTHQVNNVVASDPGSFAGGGFSGAIIKNISTQGVNAPNNGSPETRPVNIAMLYLIKY